MLEMNTLSTNDVLVVELEGALDSRTSADFKAWLEEKIIEGYRGIALDCQSLDFISSNGIAAILEIRRILNANQGAIALVHVSQEVKNLLGFLRILDLIPAHETLESVTTFLSNYRKQPAEQQTALAIAPMADPNTTSEVMDSTQTPEPSTKEPPDIEPVLELSEPLRSTEPTDSNCDKNIDTLPEKQKEEREEAEEEILPYDESNFNSTAAPSVQEPVPTPQPPQSEPETGAPKPSTPLPTYSLQTISCPNCTTALRVSRPAKYLCPACRCKFNWPITQNF